MLDVVVDAPTSPAWALAFDEALARTARASERPRPIIRTWRNPSCIVVGRFQELEREVDLAACAREGVCVLRRGSGGGTVHQDSGTLNITLVLPEGADAPGMLSHVLREAVADLGLATTATERGLFTGEAKVAGFAALRTKAASLAHATLLVTAPASRVWRYLVPAPPEHLPLDSHRSLVTSLAESGLDLDMTAVRDAVLAAATRRAGGTSALRGPTPIERAWSRRLLVERYADPIWHVTGREQWRDVWTTRSVSRSTGPWS